MCLLLSDFQIMYSACNVSHSKYLRRGGISFTEFLLVSGKSGLCSVPTRAQSQVSLRLSV